MFNLQSYPVAFFLVFAVTVMQSCSSSLKLENRVVENGIQVDGRQDDWQDRLTFVEKKNVSVGVAHDRDFLYVCLVSNEQTLRRQMAGLGFTLWIDEKGGKDKHFGIRFPIGMLTSGGMMKGPGDFSGTGPSGDKRFEAAMTDLEIIAGKDAEPQRLAASEVPGIAVKMNRPGDVLVYEMRVPVRKTEQFPYAANLSRGGKFSLGFETREFDASAMRQRRGGRPPGGFSGPRGGFGGRGGRGGRTGGRRPHMPERFKLWVVVTPAPGQEAAVRAEELEKQEAAAQ